MCYAPPSLTEKKFSNNEVRTKMLHFTINSAGATQGRLKLVQLLMPPRAQLWRILLPVYCWSEQCLLSCMKMKISLATIAIIKQNQSHFFLISKTFMFRHFLSTITASYDPLVDRWCLEWLNWNKQLTVAGRIRSINSVSCKLHSFIFPINFYDQISTKW